MNRTEGNSARGSLAEKMNSTENKFTPGPWTVTPKGSKHFIDGPDGLTVAYLDRPGERPSLANARLIAAAPELLAALNYLQSMPNDPRAHRAALDAIKAAGGQV